MSIEAMKLALAALNEAVAFREGGRQKAIDAVKALRAALAQPPDNTSCKSVQKRLQLQQPATQHPRGCGFCDHELYAATKCPVCGRETQPATGEPVARVDYSERGNIAWLFGPQLPDGTELFKRPAPSVPKDDQIAALVNKVRDIARMFHDHQSLRERIAIELAPALKASQEVKSNAERWRYAIADGGNQSMNFIDIFGDWDGDGSFVEAFDKARLADKKEGGAA